ncbi:WYL domain-containing protein [Sulfurimonas sp. SWIR-19]|uniref:helix-turn-helix transcriptional regulator n=1 Tax=Sulfurimonas sp. SWIR-19 TaxID=2878390 RepID=UPI001CF10482|nr:WYL domain-containing protein [Sulfurimonas sp. SWIR-19]UCN00132.1 WYL domain-containing protein [Sulfurimonas sp. SWIR-19]
MAQKTDKMTTRIIGILTLLNKGELLDIDEVAANFGVTKRTIQKDLNERIAQFLPVKKEAGKYCLDSSITGELDYKDIKRFAILSGLRKLYPSLEADFLADLLNPNIHQAYYIEEGSFENITNKADYFELIGIAITLHHTLWFLYNNKKRNVNPYKLANINDIWYLVGEEDGKLKTYTFTKITDLKKTEKVFMPKREFLETLDSKKSKWFTQEPLRVTLKVSSKVAEYFIRRDLLPNQVILKRMPTKELILQTSISYDEEILSIVRYWIPHIEIIEPQYLQDKLHEQISSYLNNSI